LFLSTDGYGCLRTNVPQVLVMHDLAFEHFPEQVPLLTRSYYKFFMPRFAHKAVRIATVSTYSKNDIIEQYSISPDKIEVVYNGAKQIYRPLAEAEKNYSKKQAY
jgi:glycosyltransferase involved in cell wall biosynthesis